MRADTSSPNFAQLYVRTRRLIASARVDLADRQTAPSTEKSIF
jgi:hypothetical protein